MLRWAEYRSVSTEAHGRTLLVRTEIYLLEAAKACANLDWEEFKNGSFPIRLDAGTYAEAIAQAIIQKKRILDACPERFLYQPPEDCDEHFPPDEFICPEAVDDFYACAMPADKRQTMREALEAIRRAIALNQLMYLRTHHIALDKFKTWWLKRRPAGQPVPTILRDAWQEPSLDGPTSELLKNGDPWTLEMKLLVRAWQRFWMDPSSAEHESDKVDIIDWLFKQDNSELMLTPNKANAIQILIRPKGHRPGGRTKRSKSTLKRKSGGRTKSPEPTPESQSPK